MPMVPVLLLGISIVTGSHAVARPHAAVQAERGCPPAVERADAHIRGLLRGPFIEELRARFDLGTAAADEIDVLTNTSDRETCNALWAALHADGTPFREGDQLSFHRSGNRYFVPLVRRPPDTGVRLDGGSFVAVYDEEFRLIGRFMA